LSFQGLKIIEFAQFCVLCPAVDGDPVIFAEGIILEMLPILRAPYGSKLSPPIGGWILYLK